MKKSILWIVGIIVVVALIAMWLFGAYNSFVKVGEEVNTAWSQVENQYQRRYDLIPNLVNTVKGMAEQEKAVFIGVTEARAKVGQMNVTPEVLNNPESFAQFQSAQGELSSALSRLLVAVEAYPEIKSNQNFLDLQAQLEGTENRIATERMRFNDVVKTYNIKAKSIPGVWLVSIFGMDKEKQLFESADGAETAPVVSF
ncbi:MAG: LemA family protein [Patescibacteria group bacterium]